MLAPMAANASENRGETMHLSRRLLLGAAAAAPLHRARAAGPEPIRIGVLTDLSGPYRDVTGPTSVTCVRQAVAEFTAANPSIPVEVIAADHQNKPDIAVGIARQWFDRGGVDVITDVGNSAAAIALNTVVEDKDRVHLNTAAGTSELTGHRCSPNLIHWSYDTWCLAHSTGTALTKAGGDTWFFVAADYTFGHSIQRDTTQFVTEAGGRVLGAAVYPFPGTTDFSAYLLQAQASGARVIGFANAGDDLVNCVKQAQEFGITRNGTRLAAMVGGITGVVAMGLQTSQGLVLTETFYWDMNERTRSFYARVKPNLPAGIFPNNVHAGAYAGVVHYLKTVRAIGPSAAKASGRAAVAAMKAMPTDDDCFGRGVIRPDGRKIHPAYLFQTKAPAESHYPGDVFTVLATTPADEAFRPMAAGGCRLVPA